MSRALGVWLALLAQVPGTPATRVVRPLDPALYCPGEYSDDFSALLPRAREVEQQVPAYTFCVRNVATYECPSYGPDGNLRRRTRRVVSHGTGFAYRQQGGETLLLTNEHVAQMPAVTDEDHPVEDVPAGCKRVSDALKIVDNDGDSYERDDIPLTRVVVDPQLDIAVLKARVPLPVLPWKIGHSAGLRERNVVDVRGFPLGALKATNVGKVVAAYDHDTFKDWEHDDFVIDALLSPGNSGSPVFAISCKTGEFELVGVYHAGYTRASALNVVIGVDQIRDLMTTLKRTPRPKVEPSVLLDGASRARLVAASNPPLTRFFAFGLLTAAVRARADGSLLYTVLNRDFPFREYPVLVLEDLAPSGSVAFGTPGRVWVGNRQGLKAYSRPELEADVQSQLVKVLEALRATSVTSLALRAADEAAWNSRDSYERASRLEQLLLRARPGNIELSQAVLETVEKMGPLPGEPALAVSDVLLPAAPPAPQPVSELHPPLAAPGAVLPKSSEPAR